MQYYYNDDSCDDSNPSQSTQHIPCRRNYKESSVQPVNNCNWLQIPRRACIQSGSSIIPFVITIQQLSCNLQIAIDHSLPFFANINFFLRTNLFRFSSPPIRRPNQDRKISDISIESVFSRHYIKHLASLAFRFPQNLQ